MTEIEGYRDLQVIGRGGFAVVYKALQVSVGRDVAIKLLTDPAPDDDLVRRFKRESQAVGALSWHPHIAAVVDAGSTALGQAYIVFELLEGGSLEERLEDGPMAWHDAVASMIRIADAVEAAHRADVLHRDIKPANILLDRLGVAKLGDFGIASMQDGNKTETGMLATTVAHAAPELFDGQLASPATDIYALGSTLHTLVTGLPPFSPRNDDRMGAVIARIASEPPPRPDPAHVPDQVSTVIAHALAKQPQYRPRSAATFGQALQEAQRALGQPVTAMPITDSQSASPAASAAQPAFAAPTAAESPPFPLSPDAAPVAQAPANPSLANSLPDQDNSATRNLPFTPVPNVDTPTSKPFSKLIAVLTAIAVLLAIGVGVLVLNQLGSPPAVAVTTGGAVVTSYEALAVTEMAAPFDAVSAVDRDPATYWGIEPAADGTGIVGTSYVVRLTKTQRIVSVGIANGTSTDLGRVSAVRWGTSIDELEAQEPTAVDQTIPDQPGDHSIAFVTTTNQIVLAIVGVHDVDAPNAGIAEILIQVEETSDE